MPYLCNKPLDANSICKISTRCYVLEDKDYLMELIANLVFSDTVKISHNTVHSVRELLVFGGQGVEGCWVVSHTDTIEVNNLPKVGHDHFHPHNRTIKR